MLTPPVMIPTAAPMIGHSVVGASPAAAAMPTQAHPRPATADSTRTIHLPTRPSMAHRRAHTATIAAQGYRFRVPYGTLLCVSDKPLHGELKLPGQANRFYERAISEHMRIGIETCEQLRREGNKLHSRKLRAFNEPPFR